MANKIKTGVSVRANQDANDLAPFWVDQFRVVRDDNNIQLFLAASALGQTVVSVLWYVHTLGINWNKNDIVSYFERVMNTLGGPAVSNQVQFAIGSPKVFHGFFIEMSHYGDLAQLKLHSIDVRDFADASRKATTAPLESRVRCVANLPSSVQLGIIKALYL